MNIIDWRNFVLKKFQTRKKIWILDSWKMAGILCVIYREYFWSQCHATDMDGKWKFSFSNFNANKMFCSKICCILCGCHFPENWILLIKFVRASKRSIKISSLNHKYCIKIINFYAYSSKIIAHRILIIKGIYTITVLMTFLYRS